MPEPFEIHNPFKGVDSYSELDNQTFYGRDNEKNELVRVISQHTLSLIYSKSGVGKSSLIRAGIIPIIKKYKNYFPVYIRISNQLIGGDLQNFSDAVIAFIKEAAKENKVIIESDTLLGNKPTLTEFVYLSEFSNSKTKTGKPGKRIIPILIFDQFEEIFSVEFNKASINEFLIDLTNIIESKIPDSIVKLLTNIENSDGEEKLLFLRDNLQNTVKWYRVLFSFREEYLTRFESLKDEIPSIFYTNGRFHLETFSTETAANVISEISKLSVDLGDSIPVHLAAMMSKSGLSGNRHKEDVQPFMLSLVCKSLYIKLIGPKADYEVIKKVEEEDSSLIDHEIATYAGHVFEKISAKSKKFIEEELITEDGKRTLFALSDLADPVIIEDLKKLCETPDLRYLNTVEYFNSDHIEILHDRLLKPLIESRKTRREIEKEEKIKKELEEQRIKLKQEAKVRQKKRALFTYLLIGILILATSLIVYQIRNARRYDDFIQNASKEKLDKLRTQIRINSIGGLIEIMEFKNGVENLPIYESLFSVTSTKLQELNDSIVRIFKNQEFFFSYFDDGKYTTSPKCNSKYSYNFSQNTYRVYHLQSNGYRYAGAIVFADTAKSNTIKVKFSNDGLFVAIKNSDSIYVYNIAGVNSAIFNPFRKLKIPDQDINSFRFSNDSKFLLFSKRAEIYDQKPDIVSVWDIGEETYKENLSIPHYCTLEYFSTSSGAPTYIYGSLIRDSLNKYTYFIHDNIQPAYVVNGSFIQLTENDNLITINNKTVTLININNWVTDSIISQMDKPKNCHLLGDDTLAIVGINGEIEIYEMSTHKLINIRENMTSDLNQKKYLNSFVSDDCRLFLLNYSGNIEIYDMKRQRIINTFNSYPYKFKYVYFNKDQTVNFVDYNGLVIKWHYTKVPINNFLELSKYYTLFKKQYPDSIIKFNNNNAYLELGNDSQY